MKKPAIIPPSCCVIVEMEPGASLGYRGAVLLSEIGELNSLTNAAKRSRIPLLHARELVLKMNSDFSHPLVHFTENDPAYSDNVTLSEKGKAVTKFYWKEFEPVWHKIMEERSRHY